MAALRPGGRRSTRTLGVMNPALRIASFQDLAFAVRVRTEAMREYVVKTWGAWDETATAVQVQEDITSGRSWIIEVDNEAVGLWRLDESEDHFQLDQLFILPEHQRRGIGGAMVRLAIDRARFVGVPLQVWVLRLNPAKRFYERLGFTVHSSTAASYLMRRDA